MKSSLLVLSLLTLAPAFAVAGVAAEAAAAPAANAAPPKASADSNRLWIAVHLPSVGKASWVSDDLADRFADRVVAALRSQGYKGKVGTLRPEDSAPSHASVLVVRLNSWTSRDGFADCNFNASLRTREGDRDLGVFVGDNLIVTSDGEQRIGSDGLVGSAQEAMNDLYARIQTAGLLKTN
jgi:hypothetical protein